MKLPGPDHPIAIAPFTGRVCVRLGGHIVAETDRALRLSEASYPDVFYVPRGDVRMDAFARTQRSTHCPYKGDAAYFDLSAGDRHVQNVAWSYEAPYPAMAAIRDHLAFYPDKVEIEARP